MGDGGFPLGRGPRRRAPWVLGMCAVACGSGEKTKSAPPTATATSAPVVSAPPPPPYGPGPWDRAAQGDTQALRRLAELHDAARLVTWARVEEPETGSTPKAALALRALVYADDAELAYGALAELLKAQPKRRGEVLAVVYPLALRPRRRGEALDPPGLAALIAQLKVLSRDATAPASVRDRAVSAWNAFSRAGYTAPP